VSVKQKRRNYLLDSSDAGMFQSAATRSNVVDLCSRILRCHTFTEFRKFFRHIITKRIVWALNGWRRQWTVNGQYTKGGDARVVSGAAGYRTTAPHIDAASRYTVVLCIPCSVR
jgi:hypothetical protein